MADDKEVGVYPLDLPDVILETQAFWVTLPPLPREARPSFESFGGALHAGEHGMIGLLPLFAMCDRADIGGLSTPSTARAACRRSSSTMATLAASASRGAATTPSSRSPAILLASSPAAPARADAPRASSPPSAATGTSP